MAGAGAAGAASALLPPKPTTQLWRRDGGNAAAAFCFNCGTPPKHCTGPPAVRSREIKDSAGKLRRTVTTRVQTRTITAAAAARANSATPSSSLAGCCCCCGGHLIPLQRFVAPTKSFCTSKLFSASRERRSVPVRGRKLDTTVTATREEREGPLETPPQKWTLEQLDEQLRVLQETESSASRRPPDEVSNRSSGAGADESRAPLQWPEFSVGFIAFAGIGLMLLTIVNNVLYRVLLGPPVVDRREISANPEPPTKKFRVTSLEQEREAREARLRDKKQEELAAQSRQAPFTAE